MTDRQPGAPGQYKMIMDGQEYTVTLTRDDQPIVEGTPLNKASLLPDNLAEKICPNVADPTPADALNGLITRILSATLLASGWSASAPYTQTVDVDGLTDALKAKAYPVWPEALEDKLALSEETAKIRTATRSGSTMTFECWEDKPALDIPVTVEVYV